MSRSHRHTPKGGWCGGSEKSDKRIGNRRLRKKSKQMIHEGKYDDEVFPIMDEVMNKWAMTKDGKTWFGDLKDKPGEFWEGYYDKLMRK